MELSPGKQRLLFVVVVVLLAGLGIYLLGPGRNHETGASSGASGTGSAAPAASASTVGVPSAVAAPTSLPEPASVKNANIYNWLPFTQADLDAAANVTLAFVAADETFSYTDTPATFGNRLSGLVTSTLLTTLEEGFQPPSNVQQQRVQQRYVSKGDGTISQISSFGANPASITFVVSVTVQTTTNGTTTSTTGRYDVTTVAVASGWQVNDIEQNGLGNQ